MSMRLNTHKHTQISWLPGCSSWSSRVMQEEEGEKREEKGRGTRRTDLLLNLALFQRSFTQ